MDALLKSFSRVVGGKMFFPFEEGTCWDPVIWIKTPDFFQRTLRNAT